MEGKGRSQVSDNAQIYLQDFPPLYLVWGVGNFWDPFVYKIQSFLFEWKKQGMEYESPFTCSSRINSLIKPKVQD